MTSSHHPQQHSKSSSSGRIAMAGIVCGVLLFMKLYCKGAAMEEEGDGEVQLDQF